MSVCLQNVFWQLDYMVGAWVEGQRLARRTEVPEVQERDGADLETGMNLCVSQSL